MKTQLGILLFVLVLTNSFAKESLVQFGGVPKVIETSGLQVKVYPEAVIKDNEGKSVLLKASGAGVRKKKVLFANVNVYVAASYVADPTLLKFENAMDGIKASAHRLLSLTMLRAMTGPEIRASFEESLDYNGVDLERPEVQNLLNEVDAINPKPGEAFYFASMPGTSGEKIIFETPKSTFSGEAPDLGVDFWRVWFDKPFDQGLLDLKKLLVGGL